MVNLPALKRKISLLDTQVKKYDFIVSFKIDYDQYEIKHGSIVISRSYFDWAQKDNRYFGIVIGIEFFMILLLNVTAEQRLMEFMCFGQTIT